MMLSMACTGLGTVTPATCMTGTSSVFGVPGSPATAGSQAVKKYTSWCWMVSYREKQAQKMASATHPAAT